MKIIITESQYKRIISEELPYTENSVQLGHIDPHTVMTLLAIGTAFIPVAGPFISAGIGLADAAMYYKEGDTKTAGVTAVLSMLPFIGKVVGKIPGVKELGAKGMAALASKLSSGTKLSQTEIAVANAIKDNKNLIKQELTSASSKISSLGKSLQSLKPTYIQRFGQQNYEKLLSEFLSGTADKEYFLQTLKSAERASPNLANFVSKFGIKFAQNEINQIMKASDNLFTKSVQEVAIQTKDGQKLIKILSVPKELVQKQLPAHAGSNMFADAITNTIYVVKDNIKNLSGKELENILVHEFAHIKDPSIVKSTKFINLYNTKAVKGLEDWAAANKLKDLEQAGVTGFGDKITKYEKSGLSKYYFNPNEIIANNTMVIQNLATNTNRLRNVMSKKQILDGLNAIIDYAKGNNSTWSKDAEKLLGYYSPNIKQHFEYLVNKPSEYSKLWTKLAQQAQYLKSQVNIAM